MHTFDYGFLATDISAELASVSNVLFDLRARNSLRMESDLASYGKLRQAAIVESVRGSNAIEGIVTTSARLRGIVEGTVSPLTHGEQEILGYKKALEEMYAPGFTADLSEDYVLHLHQLLLQGTSDQAGRYKRKNNLIQDRDAGGAYPCASFPSRQPRRPTPCRNW